MSTNTDVAKIFNAMATILEIKGESGFKINATVKVARVLENLVEDIASKLTKSGSISESFLTLSQISQKRGQTTNPEHNPPKEKMHRRVSDLALFI